jgi:TonB family protein
MKVDTPFQPGYAFLISVVLHALLVGAFGTLRHWPAFKKEIAMPKGDRVEVYLGSATLQRARVASKAPLSARKGDVLRKSSPAIHEQKEVQSPGASTKADFGQSDGEEASAEARYVAEFRAWIDQRKKYPRVARELGQQGRVIILLRVLKSGAIVDSQIEEASPFDRLNQAALELVAESGVFRPLPGTISKESLSLRVPIEYRVD